MSTLNLYLEQTRPKKKLLVLDSTAWEAHAATGAVAYRTSPIFPAVPAASMPPLGKQFVLSFFIVAKPFSAIARLLKVLPVDQHSYLWFSHGLCSLVVFGSDTDLAHRIQKLLGSEVHAVETWKVANDRIVNTQVHLRKPSPIDLQQFAIDYSGFGSEITALLTELRHSLYTGVHRSAQYLPHELPTLQRLATAAREIVGELQFLLGLSETPPAYFSQSAAEDIRQNTIERQKMVNQRVGHIVQINSSLAYFISQAFSGTIPLFEADCQVRSFSLLGIGSASRALSAFAKFAELTFQAYPVDEVIRVEFPKVQGLAIQTNPALHQNPAAPQTAWENPRWDVDTYLNDVGTPEKKLSLVYYSGRLGFREAEFSITAAFQVLTHACEAEWSLMTFTHEMMHSHVRGLLSAIFADPTRRFRFETMPELIERFYAYLDADAGRRVPETFLDSIGFVILAYAGYRRQLRALAEERSSTSPAPEVDTEFPDARELVIRLGESNREISEIFVHILDYNYFYNCKTNLYLGLLWTSWAPVPVVLEDVATYIWRSLLVVASQQTGEANSRFNGSYTILQTTLKRLSTSAVKSKVLIDRALDYMADGNQRSALLFRFYAALPIVDLVQKFLCASHIHGELYDDDNAEEIDDEYHYSLEAGQFREIKLTSPVTLTADRLRRALSGQKCDLEPKHAAAWFFLACSECSHPSTSS